MMAAATPRLLSWIPSDPTIWSETSRSLQVPWLPSSPLWRLQRETVSTSKLEVGGLSAPADAIDGAAAIHGSSDPADAGRNNGSCNRPRP